MLKLPFGDPDGSKANFDDIIVDFVQLDAHRFPTGIAASDNDRNIRVVVGKKGSGKTVYLRRLQDSTKREDSLFASKISEDIPSTNSVVRFCQLFDSERVTEAWQQAWRIALIRSAISHVTTKAFYARYDSIPPFVQKLSDYRSLVPKYNVERSAYTELKEIIAEYTTAAQFWKFCQNPGWDDVQLLLGSALKNCPPVFLYLDAVDDEFAHAPLEWHRCQKGLFYTVMRFMRRQGALGSRLHVIIAIRDLVFSSVLKSEHQSRYRNIPQICLLDWNFEAILYFFNQKIAQLNGSDIRSENIAQFVGFSEIENKSRGIVEPIHDYLIRHTRLIPRDIVQLGNDIAAEKAAWRGGTFSSELWKERVRQIVARNARSFAEEQIQICANQMSSHDAPEYSGRHGYSDVYTSNKEYIASKAETVRDYIRFLGSESFSYGDLENADNHFSGEVAKYVKISTALWQNGLIGIRNRKEEDGFHFYRLSEDAWFDLRQDCHQYCLHSTLLDSVNGIKVNLKYPPRG